MIPTLQSLRFVFVMMIVMSHFGYRGCPAFDAGGDCGVAFFFVLSGFALSLGYGRRIDDGSFRFRTFMRRRLLKLFPLHLLCLVLFLVLFHAKETIDVRLVFNTLLLQSWIPFSDFYFSYNAVSWFLSCLLFLYVVFPWAYRVANWLTLAVVVVLCIAVYVFVPYYQVNAVLYVNPLVRFADFFFGIMLCKAYQRQAGVGGCSAFYGWAEVVLTLLLVAALIAYPYTDAKLRNAPLYWLVILPLLPVFSRQAGPLSRCLQWPPLLWLGSLSMPMFLIHPIVFRSLFHFFPDIPYLAMLILSLTIIVALSWAIDRYFLQPIEALRKN